MESKLNEMISTSLESIRSIADSSTVVGDPIPTNNGTVIIPVSKVTLGFASGGLDYMPKNAETKTAAATPNTKQPVRVSTSPCFGGGGGTGVTVAPVCFLVIKADGSVSMLNISNPASVPAAVGVVDSVTSFVEKTPDIIERFKAMFGKKKTEDGLDDDVLKSEIEKLDEDK